MKKNFILMAAIMLFGAQNAGAWGYKSASDGWSAVLTSFYTQPSFYTPALVNEAGQWDVFIGTNPSAGFNITQNNDGSGMRLYVGLDGIAASSTNTIVRAVVKWDNTANTMFTNPTVVIPDGKIYVMIDGVKYLMTNKGSYQYEAIVQVSPTTTALSVLGDPVNPTEITPDNGLTSGAVPASVDLLIPNVPVSTTANKIRVQFNLWYNQVTVSDFVSEICDWAISPAPTAQTDWARFTWETLPNGNVEISIKPDPANAGTANDYAYFRSNGMGGSSHDGFKINGVANALSTYFTFSLHEATGMPTGQQFYDKVILTPKATIPTGSLSIQFTGLVEYKTTNLNGDGGGGTGGNLYPNISMPAYTYGTNCTGIYAVKLATPTNVAVSSNALTFTEVTGANTYIVSISVSGVVVQTFNVSGSGSAINFPLNGNYNVTVTASDNTGVNANSDPSAPASWTVSIPDQSGLSTSLYCGATIAGNVGTVNLSLETASNGDINVTINGDTWRGGGVNISGWSVAGISGSSVLDKISTNTANPQVFRPKTGITIPKGTKISYTGGTIEWTAAGGYKNSGSTFTDYVYGTNCSDTELPVVVSASIVGAATASAVSVSVNATDNIGVTQIKLKDAVNGYEQILPATTANGTATYLFTGLQGGTTYNFVVTALDLAGNESAPVSLAPYTTLATPVITATPNTLNFSINNCSQTFTLEGTNIASPLSFTVPSGYSVSPTTFNPATDGTIVPTTVTVNWVNGLGNNIVVSGGGLLNPEKLVSLAYSGFSQYCNYLLTPQGDANASPALMNANLSADKTTLTYTIAPYDITGDATWNSFNSPVFSVNNVTVSAVYNKVNNHTITVTFSPALVKNDVIKITTGAIVWTTTGYTNYKNSGNCYINTWSMTYTVGVDSCNCTSEPPTDATLQTQVSKIAVYPQPAEDVLNISGNSEFSNITVYDLSGRAVLQNYAKDKLNVSALKAGVYFAKLNNTVVKFVKK